VPRPILAAGPGILNINDFVVKRYNSRISKTILKVRVSDPHPFLADPDLVFEICADQDREFELFAYPVPDLGLDI